MKIKRLAVLIPVILASNTSIAAQVYQDDDTTFDIGGRAEVRFNLSDNNKKGLDTEGENEFKDLSRARLNFYGTQAVSDSLDVVGFYEVEVTTNKDSNTDSMVSRYLYSGFKSDAGTFLYGKQDTASTYLTDWTDRAEVFSGYINEMNVATTDRGQNVFSYSKHTDNGFVYNADFHTNGIDNSQGYSGVFAYDSGNWGLGVLYGESTSDYDNGTSNGTDQTYGLAGKMQVGQLYAAINILSGKVSAHAIKDSSFDAVDAYIGYDLESSNINLTYNYYSANSIDDLDINNIAIEYAYYYGNTSIYGAYKVGLANVDTSSKYATTDGDEAQVGIKYIF